MLSALKYLPLALNPDSWKDALNDIRLVSSLMGDPRLDVKVKAIPALATVYVLSPLDLVPAWIPILGQLDDLAIMIFAVRTFKHMVPAELMAEHQAKLGIPTDRSRVTG